MGLLPGVDYKLSFSQNDQIIRTIPSEIQVQIESDEEIDGLLFYGVYERKRVTIEGSVFFEGEESSDTLTGLKDIYQEQKVTLELIDLSNEQTLNVQKLTTSKYFAFRELKPGK